MTKTKKQKPEVVETSPGVENNQSELEQALTEENEKLIAEVERLTA